MKKQTTILTIAALAFTMLCSQTFGAQPLKGTVTYHEDPSRPVSSVIVQLWQYGAIVDETTTNVNGKYIFPNVAYGSYTIKALNTPIQSGGVDQADAQLIYDYLYNGLVLTPVQTIAADVNNDGDVDVEDYNMVYNNWNQGFTPEWKFEELEVIHAATKDNLPTMGGSSSGDVNGSFVPTGKNEEIAIVNYTPKQFSSNFTIEIFAKDLNQASAMGMLIDIPSSVNIKSVTSPLGELNSVRIENNQIVANWVNERYESKTINSSEPVLVISGNTNRSYNGTDIKFTVNNKSHFLNNGTAFKPEFSVPYLTVNGTDNLSYSYPNPASESTVIYFNLPENTKANLNIYNLNGQLVKTILNEDMAAGQHSVTISVTDLEEGVYFYNLTTNGNVKINQAKRLVVVH